MSAAIGASILDAALACIGERISAILLNSADKGEKYIASLHNEVLAAIWIIGLLSSSGSSPYVPESVKIAFHSFSDIRNLGTYATSNQDQKLKGKGKVQASPTLAFSLTEWWNAGEGVVMKEPFDVHDELIAGLLCALKMEAGSRLCARVIVRLEQARQQSIRIESYRCKDGSGTGPEIACFRMFRSQSGVAWLSCHSGLVFSRRRPYYRSPSTAFPSSSFLVHTHTLSLSLSLSLLPLARPPLVAVDHRRHPKTLPSPSRQDRSSPTLAAPLATHKTPSDPTLDSAPPLDLEEVPYCPAS
ncbi:hypothetical protein EDB85DRAFT_2151483 [Lactarius pseudohatsudake]|nr:hypothetical protein EDB85DRAFT_2151483 [Lactarius pseudohatsudake]